MEVRVKCELDVHFTKPAFNFIHAETGEKKKKMGKQVV